MLSILSLLLFAPPSGFEGNWVTKDHSVIEVLPCATNTSELCLKIVGFGRTDAPKTDENNPEQSLRSRRLCGLEIGTGFTPDGEEAKGGKVYDPESGHTYSGSMKLEGTGTLKLHGYIGVSILGRTEVWRRTTAVKSCADVPGAV